MTINSSWEFFAMIVSSMGGGGLILLLLLKWIGKLWAERIFQDVAYSNAQELEKIRAIFVQGIEDYKAQIRKLEFFFKMEFAASNAMSQIIDQINSDFKDPWKDDLGEFYEYLAERRDELASYIANYLKEHSAALSDDQLYILRQASVDLTKASDLDVAGGVDPTESAERFYSTIKKVEAQLRGGIRSN